MGYQHRNLFINQPSAFDDQHATISTFNQVKTNVWLSHVVSTKIAIVILQPFQITSACNIYYLNYKLKTFFTVDIFGTV